jgi:mannosyltransferase
MLNNQQVNYLLRIFPLLLFIINFTTRVLFLTSEDIGLDEPFTIYHAQFPVVTIIEHLKGYNNPPLYEIILHYWIRLFGISPFSVRMLPMLFACFSPLALYWFAKKNFSLRIAIASSLLLSFSYLLMYYAHDCRVYTLFTLLTILSMHFFIETVKSESKPLLQTVAFIICTTLLIYAHYFGFFVLLFQGMYLLIFKRGAILRFAGFYLIILLLYLPHLYPFLLRMGDSVSGGTWIEPPGIEGLYNALWVFSNFPFITVGCIILLVSTVVKIILKKEWKPLSPLVALIVFWFLFVYIGMFIISFWVPMYINRYLIYGLPAYYITIGLCIEYLFTTEKSRNFIMATLIICFMVTLEYNPDKKQPIAETVEFIKNNKQSETAVLIYSHDVMTNFAYYYDRDIFSSIDGINEYKVLDSLLALERIYHYGTVEDLNRNSDKFMKDVLYFGAGEQRVSNDFPVYQWLSANLQMEWKKKIGENWYVVKFH